VARHGRGLALALLAIVCGSAPTFGLEPERQERAGVSDFFPGLRTRIDELPPFLRDTHFTLHLRTFYQNVEKSPGTYEEAWAGGGWLTVKSGWLWDTFSMGATGFTSQPLYAPADREGTLLLQPDGQGFTVLGEAWAKLKYEDHELTGNRQLVDLGYVNPYDGRMAPNTFEGAMLTGTIGWLGYTAGYLTQIKLRNAETFISMSEAAGASRTNEGAALAGVRLEPWESLRVDANTVFAVDTFNTVFIETKYTHKLSDDVPCTR
jgi:hypothetical protein